MLVNILIGFVTIIIVLLLLAAVMKKKYTISSVVVINRSQADVFNYIRYIRNQEHYSKWVMADPNVNIVYTGADGEVGFTSTWKSSEKNVGEGAQEIIRIDPGVGYKVEIRFEKPFKGISYAEAQTESISPTQTRMTTTFHTSMPFPMNLMSPIFTKFLLTDMNETSQNLKRILEKNN